MRSVLQLNVAPDLMGAHVVKQYHGVAEVKRYQGETWPWLSARMLGWLGEPSLLKEQTMKYASAFYVAEPQIEIYIFIDEEPSDLPENATEIIKTKDQEELLKAVEPYFILGSGQ